MIVTPPFTSQGFGGICVQPGRRLRPRFTACPLRCVYCQAQGITASRTVLLRHTSTVHPHTNAYKRSRGGLNTRQSCDMMLCVKPGCLHLARGVAYQAQLGLVCPVTARWACIHQQNAWQAAGSCHLTLHAHVQLDQLPATLTGCAKSHMHTVGTPPRGRLRAC